MQHIIAYGIICKRSVHIIMFITFKNKYMKILLVSIIILVVLAVLFLKFNKTEYNPKLSSKPKWNNNLVLTFNNKNYTVTNQTTEDVGKKVGSISYHGSGDIYRLYSINGVDNYEKIAVETKDGYLIAIMNK